MSLVDRGISHSEVSGKVILVTGVNGAGKTRDLREARRNGFIPPEVKGIEMGNRLTTLLRRRGVDLATKDGIRKLPPDVVDANIRELVTETLLKEKERAIVVCHLVYEQDGALVSLLDHYAQYGDKIGGIIPVLAYPEDIVARRKKGSRKRADVTPEAIEDHQNALLTAAVKLATLLDVEARPVMSRPKQDPVTLFQFSEACGDLVRN